MEFKEFMNEFNRMCSKNTCCKNCCMCLDNNRYELSCTTYITKYPEEAEERLKTWISENPRKTMLQEFLEKFPNARLKNDELLNYVPKI